MEKIRSSLRYVFAVAATVAVCGVAAYPVFSLQTLKSPRPLITPPVNILNIHSVVLESKAVCTPSLGREFEDKRLPALLQFNNIGSVSPERVGHLGEIVGYMAKLGIRVCLDYRLAGLPYSSALYPSLKLIALNPAPKGYFNSPGNQEMALFDAVEHLRGIYALPADDPLLLRTLSEVSFVTLDPEKPDDSRRSQDILLALRFPAPAVMGTTDIRATRPLVPSGRLM